MRSGANPLSQGRPDTALKNIEFREIQQSRILEWTMLAIRKTGLARCTGGFQKIRITAVSKQAFRYLHMAAFGYRTFITTNDKWIYRRAYRHARPSWHGDTSACILKRFMRNKYGKLRVTGF